ncbi:MAG: hypothetical protein J6U84_08275 [Bacteroidales bacterium]|nr:hypothetical protein [Bacteroidales bacterium]
MFERYINALKFRLYRGDKLNAHRFYMATNKKLDLENPKTWSEKLLWLNKYWQPKIKALCADKYKVRDFIIEKGYSETLVPLLGYWKDARDIDFSKLPKRFVLKCNHGCRMNILVEDKSKLDIKSTIKTLNKWMNIDYSKVTPEYHYHYIDRYIICEEFLPVDHSFEIVDFKIHCFNGVPKWIGLCYERDYTTGHPKEMIMSPEWDRLMYLKSDYPDDGKHMDKPEKLEAMVEMACNLSKDFPYVRVDLYYIKGNIYFGELTFTPSGCLPAGGYIEEVDIKAGEYLNLNTIKCDN